MRRWGWRDEAILTIVVAAVQIGGTTADAHHQSGVRALDFGGYLLLAAAVAVLPARRRWPVATLAATFLFTLGYALAGYPNGPIWAPLTIAFGTALVKGHRPAAYATLLLGYGGFEWLVPAVTGNDWPSTASAIGLAAWLLLILAVSEVIRFRLAYRTESRRRALEEERTRSEEARRQASEQRLGIARELPLGPMQRLLPWGILGFALTLFTGIGIYAGNPKPFQSWAFLFKMLCVVLAGLNTLLFYTTGLYRRVNPVGAGQDVPMAAKLSAVVSLFFWFGVMFWGRMLSFLSDTF